MKIKWDEKYNTIAIYALIVICLSMLFYIITSELGAFQIHFNKSLAILNPFIIGFAISYLLNFILKFYEGRVLKGQFIETLKPKSKRVMGLLLTYVSMIVLLFLFLHFIFPQLTASIVGLVNDIPTHVTNISKLFNNSIKDLNISSEYTNIAIEKWNEFINYFIDFITNLIPMFGNLLKSMASSLWNIVLGLIISIYLLLDKENFFGMSKKLVYAVFSEDVSNKILALTNRSNKIFGRFISGKILDSFIIAMLTFVILTVFKIPYAILVSFIIGISNIIPFFGPFIGAIPSFFIILFVSPVKAFWFLLLILIIQQIDGNIIGPKILGDSLGISAFWILFALLIAGKLFGFIGMVIGVPIFTIIYSIIKDIVEDKLHGKGLPTETSDYIPKD